MQEPMRVIPLSALVLPLGFVEQVAQLGQDSQHSFVTLPLWGREEL
jgi:hypothetical protein